MNVLSSLKLLGIAGLAIAMASCAVTTDTTESSTETIENTSDASTDFTSSTSPGYEKDAKREQEIKAFTAHNFHRLREDMAVGEGEYLASLAALLNIPQERRAEFFKLSKERFSAWFGSGEVTPDEVLARVTEELSNHPRLRH